MARKYVCPECRSGDVLVAASTTDQGDVNAAFRCMDCDTRVAGRDELETRPATLADQIKMFFEEIREFAT